jgi:predicted small lipoprotein YifL
MTHEFSCSALALGLATILAGCGSQGPEQLTSHETNVVSSGSSDDVTIEITTSTLEAETGEPIELMVTIKAPPDAGARLEMPKDGRLGDFDVLSWELADSGDDALEIAERRRIVVSTFESGSVRLPGLETSYGTRSSVVTEPVAFEIRSLVEGEFDPADFSDIRGPVDALGLDDQTFWSPGMITTAAAITAFAVLAIALVIGRRRRARPRIPHEWALAELARIENEGMNGEKDATIRYERIESVLRWYVAFKFGIDAPDRTSNELVEAVVDDISINDDARAMLERIVRGGDRVKFAGGIASPGDCKDALISTREFVRETTDIQQEEAA